MNATPTAPASTPSNYDAISQEAKNLHQLGVGLIPVIPAGLPAAEYPSKTDPAKAAFTGKNPSQWMRNGEPQLLSHKRIPAIGQILGAVKIARDLGKPIGLAIVPADNLVVVDFDLKTYGGDQDALVNDVFRLLGEHPELRQTRIETTPGGGIHIYVRVADRMASWSNGRGGHRCRFTTAAGGPHRGEVLTGTRISVTAPTRNGRGPYEVVHQEFAYELVEVPDLSAIGIFPVAGSGPTLDASATQNELPRPQVHQSDGQDVPVLADLLGRKAQEALRGGRPYGEDRSGNFAGFLRELYSWVNLLTAEGLPSDGTPDQLIATAVAALGIEDKAMRVAATVDASTCTVPDHAKALARYRWHAGQQSRGVAAADGIHDIKQGPAAGNSPAVQQAKQGSKRQKRKPTTLSLSRRLECFRRCCAALVTTERNTLRRMARLRHALAALDLRSVVTSKELGAQILEAQDRRAGNTFSLLSAADREAMPKPVIRWLIPSLVPAGDLTIFGGRPKVGKTRLAVAAARSLLLQEDFLGFGTPPTLPPVILVSDDQGDADTAEQLEKLAIWKHPRLLWVRRFRVTEHDLDKLHDAIKANPGAVVIVDSLRSITRSCPFGENDPEIGALIYELKTGVMDAGGSLLLIHHCNKATESTGTEALSGHSAIAGAANTIVTLHYLNGGKVGSLPMKKIPERRLAREARSGAGADLVVTLDGSTGRWSRIGEHSDWMEQHQADDKRTRKLAELTDEQRQVLEAIGGLPSPNGGTCRQIAEILHETANPTKSQVELIRKQCKSMVRRGLVREIDTLGMTVFSAALLP
jgi:hypothetical protein